MRTGLARMIGAVVVLLGVNSTWLRASDDPPKEMSAEVARLVGWLPEDSETLIVARSVKLPGPELDGDPRWTDCGVGLAISDEKNEHWGPLQGREVESIVSGARNFKVVSAFGSLRRESCSILRFKDDLGAAPKEWTEGLRKSAKAVRSLVGREVFVFPSETVMEGGYKQTEWQGTYFVLLDSRTVLCASSDQYLETVLHRIDEAPKGRAFPDRLPEWKLVDFEAPVWMLCHGNRRGKAEGQTVSFLNKGFRVAYSPDAKPEQKRKQVEARWIVSNPEKNVRVKVELRPDDVVVVAFEEEILGQEVTDFWLLMNLYWSQSTTIFPE
jgi:hypothetical protein